MFCSVTTAPQHQTYSVQFCVPFAGFVADYGNATLAGPPAPQDKVLGRYKSTFTFTFTQLRRLHSVLNAVTRLIHRSSRYKHVHTDAERPLLAAVSERIDFKLYVLVYRCLHGLAAQYLSDYTVRQKTAPFYFCNSFVRTSSFMTVFSTRIHQ